MLLSQSREVFAREAFGVEAKSVVACERGVHGLKSTDFWQAVTLGDEIDQIDRIPPFHLH